MRGCSRSRAPTTARGSAARTRWSVVVERSCTPAVGTRRGRPGCWPPFCSRTSSARRSARPSSATPLADRAGAARRAHPPGGHGLRRNRGQEHGRRLPGDLRGTGGCDPLHGGDSSRARARGDHDPRQAFIPARWSGWGTTLAAWVFLSGPAFLLEGRAGPGVAVLADDRRPRGQVGNRVRAAGEP